MKQQWINLQQELSAAYETFVSLAVQLHQSARDRPGVCGQWTPKQVMAHLAGWDLEAARRFHLFLKGPTEDVAYDVDAFNHESVAVRQHLTWDQTLNELYEAHKSLQQAVALVRPEHLAADTRFGEWLRGRIEDYEEHGEQLKEWL